MIDEIDNRGSPKLTSAVFGVLKLCSLELLKLPLSKSVSFVPT